MGRREDHWWHKVSFFERAIFITGLLIFIIGAFLFYSTKSIFSVWVFVLGSWMLAYVVIKAAIIMRRMMKK